MPAAMLCAAVLIAFHIVVHRDAGGWVARGNLRDTSVLEGHLVEWEWHHVGEAVALLEAHGQAPAHISSQNVYRLAAAYLTALARPPGGSVYDAALVATAITWLGAAWALYTLAWLATGSRAAAFAGAVLAGGGAGYTAFVGNVDAHQFGYAAAALWLAALERLQAFGRSGTDPHGPHRPWLRAAAIGLWLCAAGYAMEIGYPLLAIALAFYGGRALLQYGHAYRAGKGAAAWRELYRTVLQLAVMVVAFAIPYFGYRFLAERVLFQSVVAFNDPATYIRGQVVAVQRDGFPLWLWQRWESVADHWLGAFPLPVTLLAVLGVVVLPWRWRLWALTVVAGMVAAAALTKPLVRDFYLAHPGVYVLAAAGVGALGSWAARIGTVMIGGTPAVRDVLKASAVVVALGAVLAVTNADLWGNYWLPAFWWAHQ